jgi:hypothetical protein
MPCRVFPWLVYTFHVLINFLSTSDT